MADPSDAAPAVASTSSSASVPKLVIELRELVVGYVKQETVLPLKQLGRYVAFGIVGSFLLGLGVVLLGVGGLRALQTETGDTFRGDWSWAPYGITVLALFVGGILTWKVRNLSRERIERRATQHAMASGGAT
jgi:hypothetical protein